MASINNAVGTLISSRGRIALNLAATAVGRTPDACAGARAREKSMNNFHPTFPIRLRSIGLDGRDVLRSASTARPTFIVVSFISISPSTSK
jgi:hypothetical protein